MSVIRPLAVTFCMVLAVGTTASCGTIPTKSPILEKGLGSISDTELRERAFTYAVRIDEQADVDTPREISPGSLARLLEYSWRRGWPVIERAGAREPAYAAHIVIEGVRLSAKKWRVLALPSVVRVRMEVQLPDGGKVSLGRWEVRQPAVATHPPTMREPYPPLQPLLGDVAKLFPAAAVVALDILAAAQAGVSLAASGRSLEAASYLRGNRYGIEALSEGEVIDLMESQGRK